MERGESILIVENGETQAVLVTAAEFDAIREHRRFVAAVEQDLERARGHAVRVS